MFIRLALPTAAVLTLSAALAIVPATAATSDADLVRPDRVAATDTPQVTAAVLAAHRYATLQHTDNARHTTETLSPFFADRTLPARRVQDTRGPLDASKALHTAVPDMCVEIEDVIVTGDHILMRLRFRGHFTNGPGRTRGQNQPIDFQASDLYRIADSKITEN